MVSKAWGRVVMAGVGDGFYEAAYTCVVELLIQINASKIRNAQIQRRRDFMMSKPLATGKPDIDRYI